MPAAKRAKPTNPELEKKTKICRMIVEKCSGFDDQVNWAVGIRSAKKLLTLYPDFDFWFNFQPFAKKYPAYIYLGGKGAEHVKKQHEQYLVEKSEAEKYNLRKEPVGEIIVPHKPISLVDFLKKHS